MKCSKHPKYQGKQKPKVCCFDCWKIYLKYKSVQPKGQRALVEAKDLLHVLQAIENYIDERI